MTEATKPKRRSIEEITADIEAISQDSEHRDQFKALRMLAAEKSSSVVLPEPMDDNEVIERIARLIKPAGAILAQIAFKRAFPYRPEVDKVVPKVGENHLTEEDRLIVLKCRSVKNLYRMFPELKKPGLPQGFPRGEDLEAKQAWCREAATKILVARQQARMKAAEQSDVGLTSAVSDDSRVPEEEHNPVS